MGVAEMEEDREDKGKGEREKRDRGRGGSALIARGFILALIREWQVLGVLSTRGPQGRLREHILDVLSTLYMGEGKGEGEVLESYR